MSPLEIAALYLGKKEKPGNSGFEDPEFEKDMKELGEWQAPYSWCACFAQMVFRKAFPERSLELKKLFDPSTRKTIDNFRAAGYKISLVPVVNSLVIWGLYKGGKLTELGHAGICSAALSNFTFISIEGNTSGDSPSRNGDRVWKHTHSTSAKRDGLSVMGFIII